ncbi:MAG TPA: alpha-L-rhamnosidase C-terminal domain-containing protein [Nocardioides sp.]|nr:alpha-L-rhamnosidase C-terminal domain-containing protein [Nocardioides sp.]
MQPVDAIVLVPWELYLEYGDPQVLRDAWPAMVRWLDRARLMASTQRNPERAAAFPDEQPHEKYLWDTGFHWGEWLVPGEDPLDGHGDFPAFVAADKGDTATAYFAWSTRHAAAIARVIGEEEAAAHYEELSGNITHAWRTEYVVDGRVEPHTQANLVRALAFDLVPDDLRQRTADDLVDLVRKDGTHLGTGFLATPYLLPVLADAGHLDVAYDLLLQDSPPSWLAMIDRGATTLWERWEGVDDDGVPHESLNHYSKGAVISFLHRYVAGLQRLEPTWRRFQVAPRPGGGITSAGTEHVTPHGPAAVSWRLDGDGFGLDVRVPDGCVAEVVLPDGRELEVGPGSHSLR